MDKDKFFSWYFYLFPFCFMFFLLVLFTSDFVWTWFFSLGFIWNWSMINPWVYEQSQHKKYKFSFLRFTAGIHKKLMDPLNFSPKWEWILRTIPITLIVIVLSLLFQSDVFIVAVFLGALSFELMKLDVDFLKNALHE
jgi:hypothetical protein